LVHARNHDNRWLRRRFTVVRGWESSDCLCDAIWCAVSFDATWCVRNAIWCAVSFDANFCAVFLAIVGSNFCAIWDDRQRFIFIEHFKTTFSQATESGISKELVLQTFHALDADGSGTLSFKELKLALQKMNFPMSNPALNDLWRAIDVDKNNVVDISEFLQLFFQDILNEIDEDSDEEEQSTFVRQVKEMTRRGSISERHSQGLAALTAPDDDTKEMDHPRVEDAQSVPVNSHAPSQQRLESADSVPTSLHAIVHAQNLLSQKQTEMSKRLEESIASQHRLEKQMQQLLFQLHRDLPSKVDVVQSPVTASLLMEDIRS